MTKNIMSPNWRGERSEAIDPAAIRFTIAEAPVFADCEGCIFIRQQSAVCRKAAEIAQANGLIDCDEALPNGRSGIYVLDKSDPRQNQIDFIAEAAP